MTKENNHFQPNATIPAIDSQGDSMWGAELLNPRSDRTRAPLSSAQLGLWIRDQLDGSGAAYNMAWLLRLKGDLDTGALHTAISRLLKRHDVLRTRIALEADEPVQEIQQHSELVLPVTDLTGLRLDDREFALDGWANAEASRPFDLTTGPLHRFFLARLDQRDHALLFVVHHIVFDGHSARQLFAELSTLYNSQSGVDATEDSPEPDLQFGDYAAWQRERVAGGAFDSTLEYWRVQLHGSTQILDLPRNHVQPSDGRHTGGTHSFVLREELVAGVQALARVERATPFIVYMAIFAVLLNRYSDQEDFLIGAPTSARLFPEVDELIGLFADVLVLRCNVTGDPTFRELLARMRRVAIDAYDHQELPFERLVSELRPERSASHHPLVQVMLGYEKYEDAAPPFRGLTARVDVVETHMAKFDLAVSIQEGGAGTRIVIRYSTAVFDGPSIERLGRHFAELLEMAVSEPEERISRLEMLPAGERRQVLTEWNATYREYPTHHCLHELIRTQAAATPDAIAIADDERSLTYAELIRKSSSLAERLRLRGVSPETIVGVAMRRSVDMVVAIVAVLEAGGAYVSLEPSYPLDRVTFILADVNAALVLADQESAPRFAGSDVPVVVVDSSCWNCPDLLLSSRTRSVPENLAYVIYTSGSTGRPKGVAITHQSATQLMFWANETFTRGELGSVLASTPLSFDLSVFEMFAPLCWGGRIVVVRDAFELATTPHRSSVTLLNTVPSIASELLQQCAIPDSLPTVCLAGESLSADLTRRLYEQHCVTSVFNLYGPSEDTTYSTYIRIDPAVTTVPIGRPLPNTRCYVLDSHGNPCPVGVAGELYLAGSGLARGYIGLPALTAERFVPDPFSSNGGERAYRTGDRVRWSVDGTLEFLGRSDQQVKIRGVRIELGEIEEVLRNIPGVESAAVIVRPDCLGNQRLIGYVTPDDKRTSLDISQLHLALCDRLPRYMVPTNLLVLDSLPFTHTGKLDRARLPNPDLTEGGSEDQVPPRTDTERRLSTIWQAVLSKSVGVGVSFFDAGGNSLSATRVMARVRAAFGTDLPIQSLFDAPSIAEMASKIDAHMRCGIRQLPKILPSEREYWPLSFQQLRLWLLEQVTPGSARYNMTQALQMTGDLDVPTLEKAIMHLVSQHAVFRTGFVLIGDEPAQFIAPQCQIPLNVADLTPLTEAERQAEFGRRISDEVEHPFDLARPPLLRAQLLRMRRDENVLVLTMHHIISDAWSMGVLLHDLSVLYEDLIAGERPSLPRPPIRYVDYATWQREWLSGERLERDTAYWTARLRGAPELLQLPTDRPRPAVQTYAGSYLERHLPRAVIEPLRTLAGSERATLYMVLLAAFQVLLYRYSGETDIVLGSPIANRALPELEHLIGFFANTLAIRADLSGNPSFRNHLLRVRDAVLADYAHQEMPFEQLVDRLGVERSLSYEPLFQVMFALQNVPRVEAGTESLTYTARFVGRRTAKFDLTLFLKEDPEGMLAWWEFSTALFDEGTISQMATHFEQILDTIATAPDTPIARLPLVANSQDHQLPTATCAPLLGDNDFVSVKSLFEARARQHSDKIALTDDAHSMSYDELNSAANRLARYISKLGVTSGTLVGVCVDRSSRMAVTMLAVIKAGAAVVALDPAYPQERIKFVVADAGIDLVLTEVGLAQTLAGVDTRRVYIDDQHLLDLEESDENLKGPESRDDLLYAIYTSGSTGTPKGVAVTHHAFLNLLAWQREHPTLGSPARTAQFATFGFCVSFQEFFSTWDTGGTVVVVPTQARQDFERLTMLLRKDRVERLYLPFTALKHLSESAWAANEFPDSLRAIVTAGEPLQITDAVRDLFDRLPDCSIHNQYGASETHVVSSLTLTGAASNWPAIPSVGHAVKNTHLYVLDEKMQPVPRGASGELYVGGHQIPRGYIGDFRLTASKLVPDPFSRLSGARMYRTGDLARFRADGSVEVLGRTDHQVKIRGFRVELGEVEAKLREIGAVRDTAVLTRQTGSGDQRIVAYVVPSEPGVEIRAAVRDALRGSLPEYMLPSAIVQLDMLPVNANGKLDLSALPAPERSELEAEGGYIAPRTPTEELIVRVWTDVLGVQRISATDNFFELGGHSLAATRVITRLRDATACAIPFRLLFESPTVEYLARALDSAVSGKTRSQPT